MKYRVTVVGIKESRSNGHDLSTLSSGTAVVSTVRGEVSFTHLYRMVFSNDIMILNKISKP